jgi:excinuclease UvrABC helicase subunit UvrB
MHSFVERARREQEEKEGELKKEAIFTELGHAFQDSI